MLTPPIFFDLDRYPEQAEQAVATVAEQLQAGQIAVLPTDTVYGLGAVPRSAVAMQAVYQAKQRTKAKPLPVQIADFSSLEQLLKAGMLQNRLARLFAKSFWPGALTMVLDTRPLGATGSGELVRTGFRLADHHFLRELILAVGGYLTLTSANLAGRPDSAQWAGLDCQLLGTVACGVKQDGPQNFSASTVVSLDNEGGFSVLREGPISLLALQNVLFESK